MPETDLMPRKGNEGWVGERAWLDGGLLPKVIHDGLKALECLQRAGMQAVPPRADDE